MKNRVSIFISALILICTAATTEAGITLIHAGELLAVPGQPPTINQTIVIEDGQIKEATTPLEIVVLKEIRSSAE